MTNNSIWIWKSDLSGKDIYCDFLDNFDYTGGDVSVKISADANYALYLNGELVTNLVIPDGITEIKNETFRGCQLFTELIIPEGVVSIGRYAFNSCTSLVNISFPNSLTTLYRGAFSGCIGLRSVELPVTLTTIEYSVFSICTSLVDIYSKSPTPPGVDAGSFNNIAPNATLYVPVGCREAYSATAWKAIPNIVENVFKYQVVYMVDGEIFATDSIAYGSEITLRDEPTKEGYTFSGWSEAPATMPASDITIEGSFAVNYYTVTYIVDGEIFATDSIAYGSELVLRDEPTKEGYTFSGWSEAPVTMPASDITIEGSFVVNYYTVTYIVDGEIFATDSIAYGSELIQRDEPSKEGYTFSGWSEAPATMPAEDIVIEGSFTPITKINGVEYNKDVIIYNIRGERIVDVDNLERGVYIIDGKKVFVK